MSDQWPAVTCLCPTYGRFERLRDAVACFLLQDYPGQTRLLILNDAQPMIVLSSHVPTILDQTREDGPFRLMNAHCQFATLGHKRQALLEAAQTPLVAHWDDDDLYLPWHLRQTVGALLAAPQAVCAKPHAGWFAQGARSNFRMKGPKHNEFEGQMVFKRLAALALEQPAYPATHSGQARALKKRFGQLGRLHCWNPPVPWTSYVYRWSDGVGHVSGWSNAPDSAARFAQRNQDFGDGRPLIDGPDPVAWARQRLDGQFRLIASELERVLGPDDAAGPVASLLAAIEGRPQGGVRHEPPCRAGRTAQPRGPTSER